MSRAKADKVGSSEATSFQFPNGPGERKGVDEREGQRHEVERKSSARCFNEVSFTLWTNVHFARTPAPLALKITRALARGAVDGSAGAAEKSEKRRDRSTPTENVKKKRMGRRRNGETDINAKIQGNMRGSGRVRVLYRY